MKVTRVIALGVLVGHLGLGVVHAQSFSPMDSPAEFPPSSYSGKQYVDSRGCVYIRAGIDGNVTWVPRVTRDRKVVCGFKPTFDKPVAGTAPAPKIDKNVVQIQPATPPTQQPSIFAAPKKKAAAPAATAAAPAATAAVPRTTGKTVTTTSKKQPLYTTPVAVPPAAKAAPKAAAAPAPQAVPKTTVTTTAPATTTTTRRKATQPARDAGSASPCRGGVSTYKGLKVRCGPQAESPVTPGSGTPTAEPPKMRFNQQNSSLRRPAPGTVVRVGEVASDVRVLPKHVYEANLVNNVAVQVPEGYVLAFDDGRFNLRRAEMTMAGKAQSDAIWTRKTPRRIIPRAAEQGPIVVARQATVETPLTSGPVVSSKSVPTEKSLRLAGTSYLQVATFDDARQAQSVAKQVRKLGYPVRIGKYESGGAVQRMVLAGPFGDQNSAETALRKVQGAGYGSAFLRR